MQSYRTVCTVILHRLWKTCGKLSTGFMEEKHAGSHISGIRHDGSRSSRIRVGLGIGDRKAFRHYGTLYVVDDLPEAEGEPPLSGGESKPC